jgi:hypothetical protein
MKDYFPDTQAKTLKEDSRGLFTRFSFLPVHFEWTTTQGHLLPLDVYTERDEKGLAPDESYRERSQMA